MITLNRLTKLIILLVVVLGAANLIVTNVLSTGGRELSDLSHQTLELQKENLNLKNKIAQHSSLSIVESQAKLLGFVPINHTLIIAANTPVAYVSK